jgi:hypothetical protein
MFSYKMETMVGAGMILGWIALYAGVLLLAR